MKEHEISPGATYVDNDGTTFRVSHADETNVTWEIVAITGKPFRSKRVGAGGMWARKTFLRCMNRATSPLVGKHVVNGVDVVITKAKGRGYDATITTKNGTQAVFGETPEIALAAAGDRIRATKVEFIEPKPRDVTVDSRDAKFVPTNGSAQQPLIEEEIDPEALLCELAAADDALSKAEIAREPYDRAVKEAKTTKEAVVARLSAAGHRIGTPQLPLGTA